MCTGISALIWRFDWGATSADVGVLIGATLLMPVLQKLLCRSGIAPIPCITCRPSAAGATLICTHMSDVRCRGITAYPALWQRHRIG